MKYKCPACGGFRIIVTEQTSYYIDTLELFCQHAEELKVQCLHCWYSGTRKDFEVKNELS